MKKAIIKVVRGFTTVELLLVVIIVGILALIAMPKYGTLMNQNKINKAKGEMYGLKSAITAYFTISDQYPPGSCCTPATSDSGINTFSEWQDILINGLITGTTNTILTSSHNWRGPYIEKIPLDPWGNPYIYRFYGSATDPTNLWISAIVCTGPTGNLINCSHGNAFTGTGGMKENHPPNKDGIAMVYSPATCTTSNTSEYNIYLWLE